MYRSETSQSATRPSLIRIVCQTFTGWSAVLAAVTLACVAVGAPAQSTLTINVNSNNGAILHGASGWLYGQAEADMPSQNLMAPLKPQYSAGKPPKGLQHAGGDVTQVTSSYLSSGGKGMQIYLQDMYNTFYPNPGITSYNSAVQSIVNSLKSDPNFQNFIYVPFNDRTARSMGSTARALRTYPAWRAIG